VKVQASPVSFGRRGPRGSSSRRQLQTKTHCEADRAATVGWPNGLRRAARKCKASGALEVASFHGLVEEEALTGRRF